MDAERRTKGEGLVPATALRCRVCETHYALDPIGVCSRCFGPLDPIYDRDEQRRTVTRESIEAGPRSLWRYAALLPVAPPDEPRLAPGCTPLMQAPRLAEPLGWELPDVVVAPIASGSMFTKLQQGFIDFLELGLVEGDLPRLVGAQAEGCSPVARAWADGAKVKPVRPNTIARSLAIGSP